jgi:uncharacterized membrane protein
LDFRAEGFRIRTVNRVDLRHIQLKPATSSRLNKPIDWTLLGLLVTVWILTWARLVLPQAPLASARWLEAVLLLLAAASTLASLARQLPAQNVILARVIIALVGGAVHSVGALTAIPFGPVQFLSNLGPLLFPPLPWAIPLLWVVLLLNARGVGRLILRPWRQSNNYGLWLIGVTVLLTVLLEMAIEPLATQLKLYWSWKPTKLHSDWYTTPWVNFLGWALCALLIMAFITPALINKKPGKPQPLFQPWWVWSLLNALLLTAFIRNRLWPAACLAGVNLTLVACLVLFAQLRLGRTPATRPSPAASG